MASLAHDPDLPLQPDRRSERQRSQAEPESERIAKAQVLVGGGEMGAAMRALNWGSTPLGPVATWSLALRMMAKFLLANRFPLLLWWGPQFCQLYNDPYRPVLGDKHPRSLGQPASECWKEIWHIIGPLIQTPFEGGPATWMEDIPLEPNRYGFLEETHFTIAYSPVPDDTAPGGVGGVLATVHEISDKIVGERRTMALRDLGAGVLEERTAEEACAKSAKILANYPKDIPFALLYLLDESCRSAHLAASTGVEGEKTISPAVIDMGSDAAMWPLATVLETNRIQVVEQLTAKVSSIPPGPWSDPPDCAAIVPVHSNVARQLAGFLVAGLSPRLRFDDSYRGFLELASSQIATAIANARAYEEERKRAEALAEIDRAKTTFFSNVSHEFRTPLTLMLGPLQELLAKAQGADKSETHTLLDVAHRNGVRLLKLVNTLLDFARIEGSRMQAVYQPTDLPGFTAELATVFRSATEKAGLVLSVECQPLSEPVYVDRDMWEKIVLNLISNAFKFTFHGGIYVTLKDAGSAVELTVRDTGVGIPQGELPRVFERFHRVHATRGRSFEGSGIGLALVQELVKLHGGTISVDSIVDQGSTFRVSIPKGKAHLPQDRIEAVRNQISTALRADSYVQEALHWLPGTKEDSEFNDLINPADIDSSGEHSPFVATEGASILLADDNADMREYVRRLLQQRYRVVCATNGKEALDLALRETPDLVLTDVMMPVMDGFGLLNALRTNPQTSAIPVLLLSARAGEESRVEGLQTGADDYVTKPFTAGELLARVGSHVALSRLREQLRQRERDLRRETELAKAALEQSEARFRAFLSATSDVMYRMSPDWSEMRYLVGKEFVADTRKASYGWLAKYIPRDDQPQVMAAIQKTISTRSIFELEHRVLRADGTLGWTFSRAVPILDAQGEIVEWFGAATDVTERKQAEERLHESEERLRKTEKMAAAGKLAASLAHEINNPLQSLTDLLYLLENAPGLDSKSRSLATTAANELARVSRIAKQNLSYYRVGTVPTEMDLAAITEESLQVFSEKFQRTGIQVTKKLRGEASVIGHADEIRQVIDNLLLNAIEAMSDGGRLAVSVRHSFHWRNHHENGVRLTIADTGCGIPKEEIARIFEPFFTTKTEKGTGLGLWVVRGIVAKHDGTIKIRSTDANSRKGTVISILWPSASQLHGERKITSPESDN